MANTLYKANETDIYQLTGCLSNCDKYEYELQPMTDIVTTVTEGNFGLANTIDLGIVFTDGRHELKEQVREDGKNLSLIIMQKNCYSYCIISSVHNLRQG